MKTTIDYLGKEHAVLSCPNCKKEDDVEINDKCDDHEVYFFVECRECKIQTAEQDFPEEAVLIWNGLKR